MAFRRSLPGSVAARPAVLADEAPARLAADVRKLGEQGFALLGQGA